MSAKFAIFFLTVKPILHSAKFSSRTSPLTTRLRSNERTGMAVFKCFTLPLFSAKREVFASTSLQKRNQVQSTKSDSSNSDFDHLATTTSSRAVSGVNEYSEASMATCSKMDGITLIRRICDEHDKNIKTFVLPWADDEAIKVCAQSIQHLLDEGVLPEFILDACLKREDLFCAFIKNGTQMLAIIDIIMDCTRLTYENTIRFVADWTSDLLNVTPDSIRERLTVFLSRGILSGPQITRIIKNCPPLLFAAEPQKMDATLETLAQFFQPDEMNAIMLTSPQVCFQDSEELVLRYEYIYFHMAIEPSEFSECIHWHELPLEEIMARHELIRRTGKYLLPDPKRPQLKMQNPPMYRIFDSDDMEFATRVAGVRKEEWILFRELFRKERSQIELERPYERIKPSLRKFYERKKAAERAAQSLEQNTANDEFY